MDQTDEYEQITQIYDECLNYLESNKFSIKYDHDSHTQREEDELDLQENLDPQDPLDPQDSQDLLDPQDQHDSQDQFDRHGQLDPLYETIEEAMEPLEDPPLMFTVENENARGSIDSATSESKSGRLRKISQQLPKIIITQSSTSLEMKRNEEGKFQSIASKTKSKSDRNLDKNVRRLITSDRYVSKSVHGLPESERCVPELSDIASKKEEEVLRNGFHHKRMKHGYASEYPKRLVSKNGVENVALISNVPFEKIRLLNDTFHTLINLRWRWIVIGTIVVHFAIWLVFAVFWYITALAHYDFEPDPPKRTCVTGGKDFVTIFLASVEAQTTIGFGDRAIDEECPESIFLFIMQLILGTGLSGVLTCVVYAKLTRPEKLSRDGVGFSKKAVISMRDGKLCLMMRAWDLNYDHIISSEFTAHFVHTYRTQEGEVIRYFARSLPLQQRQFLLWPVTLVHVIDSDSPLYDYTPELVAENSYEITVSLKGASASMGTFTQSQTSYLPREVIWGYRFPPVVKYDSYKQKYVVDHKKLELAEPVSTPYCSARDLYRGSSSVAEQPPTPGALSNFSEQVASFQLERTSSFRNKSSKA